MSNIIHYTKVTEYERLCERLRELRDAAAGLEQPDLPVSPFVCFAASRLLADTYRLISREPGARALPRIDRKQAPSGRALRIMLRDAQLALDAFRWSHSDHDADYGGDWLTWEAIDDVL